MKRAAISILIFAAMALAACKFAIPVTDVGEPTGQVVVEPSGGGMEAVTVAPDGTETPIELEVLPDGEAIAGAAAAAGAALPPPWNLLIALGIGALGTIRKEN